MVSNRCSDATVCLLEGLTLIGLILKLCVSRLSSSDRLSYIQWLVAQHSNFISGDC